MHIKVAVDARNESGSDTVIVARTDPHQALSPDEALWRVQARPSLMLELTFYLLMPLPQEKKWRHFVLLHLEFQKMANMLEGGGKIPKLSLVELDEIGYKIIAYPLSLNLIGVSMRAMEDALNAVKGGRLPPPGSLPSFNEIKDTLEFNRYYEEEKRYIVTPTQSSLRTDGTGGVCAREQYSFSHGSAAPSKSRASFLTQVSQAPSFFHVERQRSCGAPEEEAARFKLSTPTISRAATPRPHST